jgi:hypothetical protein
MKIDAAYLGKDPDADKTELKVIHDLADDLRAQADAGLLTTSGDLDAFKRQRPREWAVYESAHRRLPGNS